MMKIYLDNNATTRVDPDVLSAMMPYFDEHYGNPASGFHSLGIYAERSVEKAREEIARYYGAKPREIIFTSGATESINTAIKGTVESFYPGKRHIITSKIEHPAATAICSYLQTKGIDVTYLDVDSTGLVDPDIIAQSIRKDTALVSLLAVNNEIGTIQPMQEIARVTQDQGCLLHLDFSQGTGRVELNLENVGADFVSFSAHKCHGPKGIGALFIRENSRNKLQPFIHGGGQEGGFRGGTLNVPGIVGYGKAVSILSEIGKSESARIEALRNKLYFGICSNLNNVYLNGPQTNRLVTNLNIVLEGIDSGRFVGATKDVVFSSGAACAGIGQASHVLLAIGRTIQQAKTSFRFGLSRFTTEAEIDYAIELIVREAVKNKTI